MHRKAFGAGLAFVVCAFALSAQAAEKIRLGHSQATEESLWLMDTPGGVTPNRGKAYDAEFIPFRSASDRFKAFEAGQLECGTGTAISLIFAAANGVKFKALASISKESSKGAVSELTVRDDGQIKTIADLKGKLIALNGFKSATELYAHAAMLKAGLDPKRDARYTVVPFPQMADQLRAGQVDLVMLIEPFTSAEKKKPGLRQLFTSREALPFDEDLQTLYCGEEIIKKNPAAVKAFVADFIATTKAYLADVKAARKHLIAAKKVRIDEAVFLDLPDNYRDPEGRLFAEDWNKLQDVMIKTGFQEANTRFDAKSIIDQSFLPSGK